MCSHDFGDRAQPFGPLSHGADDGCTLTDLKLKVIDDEVAVPSVEGLRVLVFSKQTSRHDSIAEGHACVRRLAQRHGFQMTSTEDAAMFNRDALEDFDVVVFKNTTGDVLNDLQQSYFNPGTNPEVLLGSTLLLTPSTSWIGLASWWERDSGAILPFSQLGWS